MLCLYEFESETVQIAVWYICFPSVRAFEKLFSRFFGRLRCAGASGSLLTHEAPRGQELNLNRERQREILIQGGPRACFVPNAEAPWDQTEVDLCNLAVSDTTAG